MAYVSIRCPGCGAGLRLDDAERNPVCSYCGTQVHLRQPAMSPEPSPAEPEGEEGPPVLAVVGMVVFVLLCCFAGWAFTTRALEAPLVAPVSSLSDALGALDGGQWQGTSRALLLSPGEGEAADFVGRLRYVGGKDAVHLARFRGDTGERVWRGPVLGTYSDTYRGVLAQEGDHLVFADQRGRLTGFSAQDGAVLWELGLGERLTRLCRHDSGRLLLQTADDRWSQLTLADGGLLSSPAPDDCRPVETDEEAEMGEEVPRRTAGARLDGMRVERWVGGGGDGPRIAVGHREPGTRVPMVADEHSAWMALVPGVNPLTADEGLPERVAVRGASVVVAYAVDDGGEKLRLTCLERGSGDRRWDIEVPPGFMSVLSDVTLTENHVLVGHWGRLQAFELATGAPAYRIGR